MKINNENGVAVVIGEDVILFDVQSALDLIGNVNFSAGATKVLMYKENIAEDFFRLSNGLLGEILQKFTNYGTRLAIVGDFSHYTSKPLKDFMRESNIYGQVIFAADKETAIEMLNKC